MKVAHTARYGASPDAVRAMLLDLGFRAQVCAAQGALHHEVVITGDPGSVEVVVTRTQSMEGAPAAAVKLTGGTVRLVQRETWGALDAALALDIPGKPARLSGSIALVPTVPGGCDQVVTGEVTVRIPLVGGKLERLITDVLVAGLEREAEVGAGWLAGER